MRPSDRSTAGEFQHALDPDVDAQLAQLLDDRLAAAEAGRREAKELGLDRGVVRIDPVAEDVEARPLVLCRELDPQDELQPGVVRGRLRFRETLERVVIGEGEAREVRDRARSTTSAGPRVPSERFE